VRWTEALDHESLMVALLESQLGSGGRLGDSYSVYADPDPLWREMVESPDSLRFARENMQRLPVLLRLEVEDSTKLSKSFAAMPLWYWIAEPDGIVAGKYQGVESLEIKVRRGGLGNTDGLRLFAARTPRALLVSPHEAMLKRAIERDLEAERSDPAARAELPRARYFEKERDANTAQRASGKEVALRQGISMSLAIGTGGMDVLRALRLTEQRRSMQQSSWSNLAILNEWRREFPTEDPVIFHRKWWHTLLTCPGGGQYVWNEADQTMESTVYGHPARPLDGPEGLTLLPAFASARFFVTFEENGIRARMELARQKPVAPAGRHSGARP
jgi:hypothetical protein